MQKANVPKERSAKNQYLLALVVNLLTTGFGIACGWASPSISLLTSKDSPLPTGEITMEEASWVTSLLCVGGLIGNYFFGYVTSNFGRKRPLIFLAIPFIVHWILILYAQSVWYLYAGRLLAGLVGGGAFVIMPVFLSEVSSDRVRGLLGSTLMLSSNLGFLLAFIFGSYLDYYATPKLVIVLTTIFAISLFFFPESPSVLMLNYFNTIDFRLQKTENSICFYQDIRRNSADCQSLQMEMNKLRNSLGDNIEKNKKNSVKWSDLTTGPGKKAMIIGIVLAALNQACGVFAMLNYTENIFKESGSSLSPEVSSIIAAVIRLLGSYSATLLVDRVGRKLLFAISTIGSARGLIPLGLYMMFKSWQYEVEALNWIPLVSFSFVIFMASLAILTLPFHVISEVMPEQIKNFGVSYCMSVLWISQFLMLKFLPLLMNLCGFSGSMYIFATLSLLGAVFIILRMPETKGKSKEEIINALR